jgi:hypothetical protein
MQEQLLPQRWRHSGCSRSDGNLLTAARRTLDPRNLSNIVRHRDADAAKELYPLGNGVDQFHLLVEVLVEEQMQLVERWPGNLPVRFLVQIAERHCVGKKLV